MRSWNRRPSNAAYDQAARWRVMIDGHGLTDSERSAFERWRTEPGNAAAYGAVERTWQTAGAASSQPSNRLDPRLERMIDAARAEPRQRTITRRAAACVGAVLLAGAALILWSLASDRHSPDLELTNAAEPAADEVFRTAVGERSTVTLEDGSQISLNTDSLLQVAYREDVRRLILLRGQAIFDVTTDPERPFIVEAGMHRITALGTAFDVRLDAEALQVTLIEGVVTVEASAEATNAAAARLDPGQQFIADGPTLPRIQTARIDQVTAWQSGKLIFSDDPLAQAVAEVNRYSNRKIRLADAALGRLRVSGVFRTGRPDTFVAAVTSYFPVTASAPDDTGDVVLHATGP